MNEEPVLSFPKSLQEKITHMGESQNCRLDPLLYHLLEEAFTQNPTLMQTPLDGEVWSLLRMDESLDAKLFNYSVKNPVQDTNHKIGSDMALAEWNILTLRLRDKPPKRPEEFATMSLAELLLPLEATRRYPLLGAQPLEGWFATIITSLYQAGFTASNAILYMGGQRQWPTPGSLTVGNFVGWHLRRPDRPLTVTLSYSPKNLQLYQRVKSIQTRW